MSQVNDMDRTLVWLTEQDGISVRQLFEGVMVFGTSGGTKTTTTAQMFANAFMESGYGGLVLTAKVDETPQWIQWAKECGREKDLVIFKPDNPYYYDFMEKEARRNNGSDTETMVGLFMLIIEIANGGSIQSKETYWLLALRQMLRNTIDILKCAGEVISVEAKYRFIVTAPTSISRLGSGDWQKESYCFKCLNKATDNFEARGDSKEVHFEDFDIAFTYWTNEFPNLAEKTRSIIVSMFTTTADAFLRGNLKGLFNTDSNKLDASPEMARQGKIIILDLPIKKYEQVGVIAQGVYKLCFQKTMERVQVNSDIPNVFLFADECQFTLTSYEDSFQTTARSSRIATFYLTQSLSNLHLNLGDKGEQRTNSLLTNLGTKIFHAQVDNQTNEWAAKLIGEDWTIQSSSSSSFNQQDNPQLSASFSESRRFIVEPIEFTKLLRGGEYNDFIGSAIVHQVGRTWSNGDNYLEVFLKQHF
ncbi:MAG: TraM recognition domain-containing protein [Flavobacteriales bacterium]|nr:TraM recognition domain-containing protein [Flavobacteriales bacterium]